MARFAGAAGAVQRLRRHRPGGGHHHLLLDRGRRAGAQAARPEPSGGAGAAGRAAHRVAGHRHPAVRAAAVAVHARAAAPAGRAREPFAARHRGRDPRDAGRRHQRRRDRAARARDGAQRVPAGRPAHRLADGAARRRDLPGRAGCVRCQPRAHRGLGPRALPGGEGRTRPAAGRGPRAPVAGARCRATPARWPNSRCSRRCTCPRP